MKTGMWILLTVFVVVLLAASVSCDRGPDSESYTATGDLSAAELENLVRRSYQYVALFNTLNNFAVNDKNPFAAGGWNKTHYPQGLMDASVRAIPRPNNDTLYVLSLLDLRNDAVVIEYPAFHSKFVSLETSTLFRSLLRDSTGDLEG